MRQSRGAGGAWGYRWPLEGELVAVEQPLAERARLAKVLEEEGTVARVTHVPATGDHGAVRRRGVGQGR